MLLSFVKRDGRCDRLFRRTSFTVAGAANEGERSARKMMGRVARGARVTRGAFAFIGGNGRNPAMSDGAVTTGAACSDGTAARAVRHTFDERGVLARASAGTAARPAAPSDTAILTCRRQPASRPPPLRGLPSGGLRSACSVRSVCRLSDGHSPPRYGLGPCCARRTPGRAA